MSNPLRISFPRLCMLVGCGILTVLTGCSPYQTLRTNNGFTAVEPTKAGDDRILASKLVEPPTKVTEFEKTDIQSVGSGTTKANPAEGNNLFPVKLTVPVNLGPVAATPTVNVPFGSAFRFDTPWILQSARLAPKGILADGQTFRVVSRELHTGPHKITKGVVGAELQLSDAVTAVASTAIKAAADPNGKTLTVDFTDRIAGVRYAEVTATPKESWKGVKAGDTHQLPTLGVEARLASVSAPSSSEPTKFVFQIRPISNSPGWLTGGDLMKQTFVGSTNLIEAENGLAEYEFSIPALARYQGRDTAAIPMKVKPNGDAVYLVLKITRIVDEFPTIDVDTQVITVTSK